MIVQFLLALFVPFIMMAMSTRLTYSLVGSAIVTWMVCLFALNVHTHILTALAAIVSFAVGYMYARKKFRKY